MMLAVVWSVVPADRAVWWFSYVAPEGRPCPRCHRWEHFFLYLTSWEVVRQFSAPFPEVEPLAGCGAGRSACVRTTSSLSVYGVLYMTLVGVTAPHGCGLLYQPHGDEPRGRTRSGHVSRKLCFGVSVSLLHFFRGMPAAEPHTQVRSIVPGFAGEGEGRAERWGLSAMFSHASPFVKARVQKMGYVGWGTVVWMYAYDTGHRDFPRCGL